MAHTIEISVTCASCKGEGSRIVGYDEGEPIYEDPCTGCGGDGRTAVSLMDDTLLNDILDKCNDILDKCNDILEAIA